MNLRAFGLLFRSFVLVQAPMLMAAAVLAAIIVTHAQAACLAPPSGLVSWWSGDDTANDLRGFNHGTVTYGMGNGAGYTNGIVGRAFTFDGGTNYVQSTTWGMNLGTLDFTILGWEKTTSTKPFSALVEFDFHNPLLGITGAGTF